jgi:hypothetical protein
VKTRIQTNKGFALTEIIVGSAIILLGILAINTTFNVYLKYALANQKSVQATYLLEETLEVMAYLRDQSWSGNVATLSTTTTYYLSFSGTSWATTTIPQYIDGEFLRNIRVFDVERDANNDIVAEGTYDPNTKLITATVSYYGGHATTTKSLSMYLSNI